MPQLVFAYLDPGTGSYVLQIALAGALAASYAVKHFWSRVKAVFRRPRAMRTDQRP